MRAASRPVPHSWNGRFSSDRMSRADCSLGKVSWLFLSAVARASGAGVHAQSPAEDEVISVALGLHAALAAGDSARATSPLADDAVTLEASRIENREEDRSSHMGHATEHWAAVRRERGPFTGAVMGDAGAHSTLVVEGRRGDSDVDLEAAELVVLSRGADGWIIRAVHGSTRRRTGAP